MPKFSEFSTVVYEASSFSNTITKGRARIFYKGCNRNGSYIGDEFAEKLSRSLNYTPVKGIYENGDFTDHGSNASEGRIYGIIPKYEDANIAWESHTDEDGVEREYLCADVYLYTAIYKEANEIIGKSLSMELYPPSIKYHREEIDGIKYAVFEEGEFLGVEALGNTTEPCFEGAAFFSLQENVDAMVSIIKEMFNYGGKSEMPNVSFKLSDDKKKRCIHELLNPVNESGDWEINYAICDVYDEYALVYNYESNGYERVYYTKDDENDTITLGEKIKVFVVDVTESEMNVLKTLHALNGASYELVKEELTNADKNAADCVEFSNKITELENTISTLTIERDSLLNEKDTITNDFANLKTTVAELNGTIAELSAYKLTIETQHKKSVIEEYSDKLDQTVIENYTSKLDEFTVEDLDKELAYELKKANPSIFNKADDQNGGYYPTAGANGNQTGITSILDRYKNKN